MYIIGSGATILLNMYDSLGSYLIAVDIMQGLVTPIYPDAYDVLVSRDLQVVVLFTEEGVALMSAQTIAETPDQDAILGLALLWLPPETWTVKVNPREEWMQMYDEGINDARQLLRPKPPRRRLASCYGTLSSVGEKINLQE